MFAVDRFWIEDPLPVPPQRLTALYVPHPLRCGWFGCCKPIAWMTTDRRLPYLGACDEHRWHTTTVPVTVYEQFSNFPEDVRAYAARQLDLEIARMRAMALRRPA